MVIWLRTIIILICMVSYSIDAGAEDDDGWSIPYSKRIWETVKTDHINFYSAGRLLRLGVGFGVGGIMANTKIDEKIQDKYQDDLRSSSLDDVSDKAKTFGEGKYLIPLSLITAALPEMMPENSVTSTIGKWGRLTSRAYLVGAPPLLLMQRATGASRPDEDDDDSRWKPFDDSNGVSGHAFMGAAPFLCAGRMSKNRLLRYGLYAASTLTAWSRVNDNDHYTSQALLGWYLAWEAVGAVSESNENAQELEVSPLFLNEGVGIQVTKQF